MNNLNAIIDKSTFKVVAVNRQPQANEFVVQGVSDLQKEIQVPTTQPKVDVDGNTLYRLPQPDLEVVTPTTKTVETNEVTDKPVMIKQINKIPLLDQDGNQVSYQPTTLGETTEVTDEPVMEIIQNDDNVPTEQQKVDELGNLLYWGQVISGSPIACFTTEEVEVQKTDDTGALLYHKDVVEDVITYESQSDLEVTDAHESWTEDLEVVEIEVEVSKTVTLSESPEDFTYEEVEPTLTTYKQIKKDELYSAYQRDKLGQVVSSLVGEDGLNIVFPYGENNQNDYRSIGITFALDETQTESIIGSDSHGKFYIQRTDFLTLTKEFQEHEVLLYMKMKEKESEVDACSTVELLQSVVW